MFTNDQNAFNPNNSGSPMSKLAVAQMLFWAKTASWQICSCLIYLAVRQPDESGYYNKIDLGNSP
jgi:hypothetical protein